MDSAARSISQVGPLDKILIAVCMPLMNVNGSHEQSRPQHVWNSIGNTKLRGETVLQEKLYGSSVLFEGFTRC